MADVAVIGLGQLGLPLAAALVGQGFEVVGVDTDQRARLIANRQIPFLPPEPGLAERLAISRGGRRGLTAIASGRQAVKAAPITIVMVNTPSDLDGGFSLRHVLAVCVEVGEGLREKGDYHVVIISSTVMPGSCEGPIRDILEVSSGKTAGEDFGLCYCPEFIALGNAVEGFLRPDFVVIGSSDPRSRSVVTAMYNQLCVNDPPVYHMSMISAEIAKIGLNVAVVSKMTMAAQVTWMCQCYPGADADDVLRAIAADERIGEAFFSRILWPGGPCFPRDSQAFVRAALKVGQTVPVAEATANYLHAQVAEMGALVQTHAQKGRVGVLGLTYKLGVDSTVGSYGLALVRELIQRGLTVEACDPRVPQCFGRPTLSLGDIVASSETLAVTVERPEFKALENMDLSGKTVVDCRGFLDEDKISAKYVRQGRGI